MDPNLLNNQPVVNKGVSSNNFIKFFIFIAILILAGMVGFYFYTTNQDKIALEKQLSELNTKDQKLGVETNFSNTNFDEAIMLGEKLISDNPSDVTNYIMLANSYLQRGSITFTEEENANKAIEILEKAISIDSRVSEVYRVMGYAYEIKQDYKQAQTMYDTAIEINPDNDVAYGARGHMYFLIGNEKLAEADLKKSLEINPENDKALLDLAGVYFRNHNDGSIDIEEIILRVIALSDNNNIKAEAFQLLGSLYYSQKLYQKAERQFAQAVQLEDRFAMGWTGLAMSLILQLDSVPDEKFDESVRMIIDAIERALTISPDLSRAYVAEGLLSAYLAEYEAEKAAYENALKAIPNDITLSKIEKEELRLEVEKLLKGL